MAIRCRFECVGSIDEFGGRGRFCDVPNGGREHSGVADELVLLTGSWTRGNTLIAFGPLGAVIGGVFLGKIRVSMLMMSGSFLHLGSGFRNFCDRWLIFESLRAARCEEKKKECGKTTEEKACWQLRELPGLGKGDGRRLVLNEGRRFELKVSISGSGAGQGELQTCWGSLCLVI